MAPKSEDGGSSSVVSAAGSSTDVDWEWIGGLDATRLGPDDLGRLIPVVTDWAPTEADERARIESMFLLASSALRLRDVDFASAKTREEETVKESKDLRKEVKKLRKEVERWKRPKGDDDTMEVRIFEASITTYNITVISVI